MDKKITKRYCRRAKIIDKTATPCAKEDNESIHSTKQILSYDVLFSIFLKLPNHTLARCKFVSKDFNAVISDAEFLVCRNHSIIMQAQRKSTETSTVLFKLFRIGFPKVEEIPLEMPPSDPYLVGSCHGLLCFLGFKGNSRVHYVYNSLTEKWISSPPIDSSGKRFCVIYHKKSTGAYHLLTHLSRGQQFMVHELGTQHWRAVSKEGFPYVPLQVKQSTPVAMFGCIYWICHSFIGNARRMIVAFDVETEQLSSVKEPPRVKRPYDDCEALTLVETDVGLGYPTFNTYTMNIWVMKGRDSAWEKVYAINLKPIQGSLKTHWDDPVYVVMQCTMGEIWFTEHGQTTGGNRNFIVYDCKSCTFKSVDLRNWLPGCVTGAIHYAPCLWKSSISLEAF
ncbi:F-box protein [Rhynchospora pubera]|uniref:F-box protein n=1 Tax=Rhynchospora pubera TaxID=906938 RepID=A0AAV8FP68_9POAL|nr:F-box protein [Rhynchospora pubera]